MRYILLIYDDEKGWANLSEAERQHSTEVKARDRRAVCGRFSTASDLEAPA